MCVIAWKKSLTESRRQNCIDGFREGVCVLGAFVPGNKPWLMPCHTPLHDALMVFNCVWWSYALKQGIEWGLGRFRFYFSFLSSLSLLMHSAHADHTFCGVCCGDNHDNLQYFLQIIIIIYSLGINQISNHCYFSQSKLVTSVLILY